MAAMNRIPKANENKTVEVIQKGKPNARAKVVGTTAKKVRVVLYDGKGYEKDANGNPKKRLVDPESVKV